MDFDQTFIDTLLGGLKELILLNQWMEFCQTFIDILLGGWKELIRFL